MTPRYSSTPSYDRLPAGGVGPLAAPLGDDPYAGFETRLSVAEEARYRRAIHAAIDACDQRTVDAYARMIPALVRAVVEERVGLRPAWAPPEAPPETAPGGPRPAAAVEEGQGWEEMAIAPQRAAGRGGKGNGEAGNPRVVDPEVRAALLALADEVEG